MNKKGMTTIELITSFALATVIFIILFNLLISLKDIYMVSGSKTNMLIEQANLNKAMNESINSTHKIQSFKVVSENEFIITTDEGEKNLNINVENKSITFDKYTLNLPKNIEYSDNNEKYIYWNNISTYIHLFNNRILVIDIPLIDNRNNDKYNIKMLYQSDEAINIE